MTKCYFVKDIQYLPMYMCLLPPNQLLCQQAALSARQLCNISIHISSLIRIERGLLEETRTRTLKIATFLTKIQIYIDVYVSAAPKPALVSLRLKRV